MNTFDIESIAIKRQLDQMRTETENENRNELQLHISKLKDVEDYLIIEEQFATGKKRKQLWDCLSKLQSLVTEMEIIK